MDQTSPSVVSGTVLAGKYRVDRLLGEGGMGVVLAATNEALRQRVAIKLLRSGALANAKALGRFEREARAAASLRSEHVARVLDVGKLEDGRPYMVMEYLEGQDLGDLVDRGPPLAVGEVVDLVLQACEAVAEAHACGIIHRDLKPTNLFLTTTVDGRPLVKVLDFGISKMEEADDLSLTRSTDIIGSPSYMSPEQLRASKAVDVRTDVWALGVILYELLTKKLPYVAATVTELVAVILSDPVPDVRALRADVPEGLALAILRCMEKPRERRFASVTELVEAIAPFGTGSLATMAERISRVAQGSGRLPGVTTGSGARPLPAPSSSAVRASNAPTAGAPPSDPTGPPVAGPQAPPPASSARLAINGGTSVAWGETQVAGSPPVAARSRRPLLAASAALLLLVGAAGAFVYVNRASATPTAAVPPPPASMTLPEGRKDLPPNVTSAAPREPQVTDAPSSLPSGRGPVSEATPPSTIDPRRVTKPPRTPTTSTASPKTPAPAPPRPTDPLDEIGRH